jgi:hypothetical protein
MKWGDLFRPRYFHSDLFIRHEALNAIKDPAMLRQVYAKADGEYGDIRFAAGFLLKDKKLIYDLMTEKAYWYYAQRLSSENITTLLDLEYSEEEYLEMCRRSESFPMQLAVLVKIGRFDRIRDILKRVYDTMQESRVEILKGTYDAEGYESKIWECFRVLPDDTLDVPLLKIVHHALLFSTSYRGRVFERYLAAGWQQHTVSDRVCHHCKGAKTEMGRFAEGTWEVQCTTCQGTGLLRPFVRMTKGDEAWEEIS